MAVEPGSRPSLEALFRQGETRSLAPGGRHFTHAPGKVWQLTGGGADIYAELGEESSPGVFREHLGHFEAGDLLFGLPLLPELQLLASGRQSAGLVEVDMATLAKVDPAELAPAVDRWITRIGRWLDRFAPGVDFVDEVITPGSVLEIQPGQSLAARRGVVWVEWTEGTVAAFARHSLPQEGSADDPGKTQRLPLTPRSWLRAETAVTLTGYSTRDVLTRHGLTPLQELHPRFLTLLGLFLARHLEAEQERLGAKADRSRQARRALLKRLSAVIDRRRPIDEGTPPLLAACLRIGRHLGVDVVGPTLDANSSVAAQVEAISRRSRLRARQVMLRGRWWLRETSPMLAFHRDHGDPLVLLPGKRRRLLWSPELDPDSPGIPVDEEVAATLAPMAFSFYRVLPDRALGVRDLIRFATSTGRRDLAFALVFAAIGTVLGLAIPIALGVVIDVTVPSHQPSQLVAITVALVVVALAVLAFQICRDLAIVRFGGRTAEALQPAILDRLLRLPNTFFRRYSAGDLAERVITLEHVQSRIGEGALSALVTGTASLANFVLLLAIQPRAAGVAALLLLGLLALLGLTLRRQQKYWNHIHRLEGQLSSLVLETISGIHRIRLAAAEDRLFVRWGQMSMDFRDQLTAAYTNEVRFNAFARAYQILCLAILFAVIPWLARESSGISTGAFLAFVAAFSIVLAGFVQIAEVLLPLVELVPMFRRIQPVLENTPENDEFADHPGVLSGQLEIHGLSFRYGEGEPLVLDGLSLEIEQGQSVAIVGPSGCGKSTLFRLILGFEKPSAGSLYFDGKDLATLDLREVRHQIGVVLQRDQLMEATIYENIQGDNDITLAQAWEAARQAGIADDIGAMPLGLHTVISAEGSDLSGGQVQRLLIARALAARPRILLLDEATSALDNKTQSLVTESLDRLRVTRIAIAHRLSTVEKADRIFVIGDGKIVESGPFDELMAQDGVFADLVRRQLK